VSVSGGGEVATGRGAGGLVDAGAATVVGGTLLVDDVVAAAATEVVVVVVDPAPEAFMKTTVIQSRFSDSRTAPIPT
jgi:hypothetical protein